MKHDSHQLIKIKAGWVHGCTMITQSIMPVLCIFKTCDNCLKTKRQWKSLMVSWKFLNMKLSWSSNSIPIYTSRGAESKALTQYQYTSIHRSIIHNSQKVEITQASIKGEWINKIVNVLVMEYYSAIKRSDILLHGWTLKTLCLVK